MHLLPTKRSKRISLLTLVALILSCILVTAWHSEAITSITVTLKENATEPRDRSYLSLGEKHVLPDYKLLLRAP